MGAIARHCDIESAALRAFKAGEDMLLICATPDKIHRGYRSLLNAAKEGRLPKDRMRSSLRRIAATKAIVQPPLPFDLERIKILSNDILKLNEKLNYTYGGTIK
jgi:beta-glucosidase-like glycosyl hydrolase